ncbi:phosphatidylserine decarboxylase [Acrasis kona]|uniref:phosphatidylserine decarboxylase n=1 Tax=Acrasis kona TaxID=1008807 RepID=A0AAW2YSC5_9EUKA
MNRLLRPVVCYRPPTFYRSTPPCFRYSVIGKPNTSPLQHSASSTTTHIDATQSIEHMSPSIAQTNDQNIDQTKPSTENVETKNTEPPVIEEEPKKKKKKSSWKYRFAVLGALLANAYFALAILSHKVLQSEGNEFVLAENKLALLQKLPLNGLSRFWGWFYGIEIPKFSRALVYNIYAYYFNVNLDEVELPLNEYPSLQRFFTRHLKSGIRPTSEDDLVSPVDGEVVAFGRVNAENNYMIEQVKGLTYPVEQLLDMVGEDELNQIKNKNLYYCVFYLAPGDYHRYHSPTDFVVEKRKHIPGYLFPVMPVWAKIVRGLFALNERVVLDGKWKHGAFHYVIVGATNVGSITVNFDNSLKTNMKKPKVDKKKDKEKSAEQKKQDEEQNTEAVQSEIKGPETQEVVKVISEDGKVEEARLLVNVRRYQEGGLEVDKAQEIGHFEMGSTIILVFEHDDPNFNLKLNKGQNVKLGQSLLKE